ncbi:MAG: hypothetical protein ACLQHK_06400 [Gallionellaceae bacterium]
MIYKGSCHCGHIAFAVEGDLHGVIECNCSIRGCAPLGTGTQNGVEMAPIIVRCQERVDLSSLKVQQVDGRRLQCV